MLLVIFQQGVGGAPPIPPPTIDYQGDGKKRRRRRNRTQELFNDIEQTIHALIYGDAPVVPTVVTVGETDLILDPSQGFDAILDHLLRFSAEHQDLSTQVARLRREVEQYERRQEALLDSDDDDFILMMH